MNSSSEIKSRITPGKVNASSNMSCRGRVTRLKLLAAVSGIYGIATTPAGAVEIGEIDIQSKLGQPLRASISYALNANEQIHDYCIFLRSGAPSDGIPMLSRARLQITDNAIIVTGRTPIREPMLMMQLEVNCPYTPRLSRLFALLVNPAQDGFNQVAARQAGSVSTSAITGNAARLAAPAAAPESSRQLSTTVAPIAGSARYQVQPGDTLSGIASRTEGRTVGLMPFADAIFAANPDAFINDDKNLLKAGSWLSIPDASGVVAAMPAESLDERAYSASQDPASENVAGESGSAASGMESYTGFSAASASSADAQPFDSGFESLAIPEETVGETPMFPDEEYGDLLSEAEVSNDATTGTLSVDAGGDLRPGDVIVTDQPTTTAGATAVQASAPDVPVVSSPPAQPTGGSWNWLLWAGGGSLGFLIAIGLFSKRIRERFGVTPSPAAPPLDAAFEDTSIDLTASQIAVPDVDFQFDETPVAQPEIELDADLGDGSGLQSSADIDVAQDFGFSAENDLSSEMDLELPPMTAEEEEQPSTDIIPPNRVEESSILESEIPPSEDGDDTGYDLSMIVDATKQRIGETEQTARDLMAVQVNPSANDAGDADNYTRSQEVDLQVLEQDYEEELTATQALNAEIAKAAFEIAEQMEDTAGIQAGDDSPTGNFAEIPLELSAELPDTLDLDVTAELTGSIAALDDAVNDDLGDYDATEIASLDDDATEIADPDATEIADLDDTTINEALPGEIQSLGLDPTVEMEVEGGRVNTKKSAS